MANSTSSYFSNQASVGLGAATAGQFNKFDLHASPKYPLGFKVEQYDGTVYRYAHTGAATNRGLLVSQDLSESSIVDTDNVIVAPASATSVSDESMKPGSLGSHYVEITLASQTADNYKGAKFVTTDDTGEGYTYDVLGNTATGDPVAGNFRIRLAQPLQVALDATTDFAITGSKYTNLEAGNSTDSFPAGVTCATTTAALPYCWIQSKGTVGALQTGTIAVGDIVVQSAGTSGAVEVFGGGGTNVSDFPTEPIIGYCVDPGDTTGHGTFNIDLE